MQRMEQQMTHSRHPFNSNLPAPEIPALPMENPVPPALISKATPPAQVNTPVNSTGVTQPSITSGNPVEIPSTPKMIQLTKQKEYHQ